jgi:hypothetical protein
VTSPLLPGDDWPDEPPPMDGWDADGQPYRDVDVSPNYL